MKSSLIPLTIVLALAYAVGFVSRLAGSSLHNINGPAIIGGVFAFGLVLLALSDYSHKPRFRVRSARKASARVPARSTSPVLDAAADWTYTTVAA